MSLSWPASLRRLPWQDRRKRRELLARAFEPPIELSPLVDPSVALVQAMESGRIEGLVLKQVDAPYRDGSRAGWAKVKDASWYARGVAVRAPLALGAVEAVLVLLLAVAIFAPIVAVVFAIWPLRRRSTRR